MEDQIKNILQGEDIDCKPTFLQKNGNPLDMSDISTKIYITVSDGYKNVVVKFKNGSPAGGYTILDDALSNIGTLQFKVLSTITKNLEPGKYYIELRARFASGIHTDDGYYDVGARRYGFSIISSDINSLGTLP